MNIFNTVKVTQPKKSAFDLTHDVKLSCNMGELVPILNMDCLPGDQVKISGETLVRFAPMLAPMMHQVNVFIHYFFCPWRILWARWETFITGKNLNPQITTAPPAFPVVDWVQEQADPVIARLGDYLGVPTYAGQGTETSFYISAMPFAVYDRIWYEYYRDQNFQLLDSTPWELDDGPNTMAGGAGHGKLRNRAWEHDYFTAALPWAQKGPTVEIPMQQASVGGQPGGTYITDMSGGNVATTGLHTGSEGGLIGTTAVPSNIQMLIHAGTINDLRRAKALQTWLEVNARAGSRYKENILGHFGEMTLDERLQRPEYICGLKTPVVVSQVLQMAPSDTLTPLATMAGHGAALSQGDTEYYHVREHGTIMGIMSIMPRTAYQQGLPRQFIKFDFLDYGFPEFAHLGEQAIDYNEIYAFTTPVGDPTSYWGYIPRYAEYKFMPNRVCGDFKTTLNYWHMGRIFGSGPSLGEDFIVSDPTTRIFAVTDPSVQHMYCQVLNHIEAIRPLPKYGTPGW